MLIRKHRGTFDESMKTAVEIAPTRQAVSDWFHEWWIGAPIPVEEIKVLPIPHGMLGAAHVVMVDELGVLGFTDGPLEEGRDL